MGPKAHRALSGLSLNRLVAGSFDLPALQLCGAMNFMPDDDEPIPLCPKCDEPMALSGATPREPPNPETRRYVCLSCGELLAFSEDEQPRH